MAYERTQATDRLMQALADLRSPEEAYQLLDRDWMSGTFDACDGHMTRWLEAWRCLEAQGGAVMAADVRAKAGLDDGWAAGEAVS